MTHDGERNIVDLRFGPEMAEEQNVILAMITVLTAGGHIKPLSSQGTRTSN